MYRPAASASAQLSLRLAVVDRVGSHEPGEESRGGGADALEGDVVETIPAAVHDGETVAVDEMVVAGGDAVGGARGERDAREALLNPELSEAPEAGELAAAASLGVALDLGPTWRGGTGKRVEAASFASGSSSPSCGRVHPSTVHEHRKEPPNPRAQSGCSAPPRRKAPAAAVPHRVRRRVPHRVRRRVRPRRLFPPTFALAAHRASRSGPGLRRRVEAVVVHTLFASGGALWW